MIPLGGCVGQEPLSDHITGLPQLLWQKMYHHLRV